MKEKDERWLKELNMRWPKKILERIRGERGREQEE